jgi:cytochrome P450
MRATPSLDRAHRHELRLLAASRPAFPVLLTMGRFAGPIRRIPSLGWLISDPIIARRILTDRDHFTIVGEGIVGHLWAQVLGDWVYDMFDGAGAIVARMTSGVAAAWRDASADTMLGRCRELGLGLRETKGLATLLMVAGTQTTASAMARTVALLHDTGEQHRLRAQPRRIDDAVREGLRVTTPVPVIGRSVSTDLEIAGRRLRAGQRVLMLAYTADNAPGNFDLDRANLPDTRQLWFGAGRHYCLGSLVGRAEVSALLDALLAGGRPWRVVERRCGRGALIPTYARLRIALA